MAEDRIPEMAEGEMRIESCNARMSSVSSCIYFVAMLFKPTPGNPIESITQKLFPSQPANPCRIARDAIPPPRALPPGSSGL